MPYIIRDIQGKITRATVQAVHGAELVAYDHPDLIRFLENNGQDPMQIERTLSELRRTDSEMARAVEDVVMALLKKNVLKMTDLPKPVQERMAYRVKLRLSIQEAFDLASDKASHQEFAASANRTDPPGSFVH
ncbi:MAG: hypothetical protein AB7E52_08410 [Bdellovibrionales bacterium]